MAATERFLSPSWYRVAALRLRLREHLTVRMHHYRGKAWYVIADGIRNRVHRVSPAGYVLVASMNGVHTLDRLWTDAAMALGEQAPTQDQVIALVGQLHANDLVAGDVAPDAAELFERQSRLGRSKLLQWVLNPLAIRIALLDPNECLTRTLPFVRPLIGVGGAIMWLLAVLPAVVLAAKNWPELSQNINDRVLSPDNLLLMAAIYPMIKLLHELAHGYTTRARDGEVHELGVMLLALLPLPYIEVSAAAGFRSKWSRCLVGLAGILAELFIAALAFYVWLLVEPGFLRALAFNVMLTAGVSSLLFNGNPLLRYDGYYVLADAIEVPNLALRGGQYWLYLISRYLFGVPHSGNFAATLGERMWFLAYMPISTAYRVAVTLGIALFLASKYLALGVVLAIWGLASGVVLPVMRGIWAVVSAPAYARNRARAVSLTGAVMAAGLLLLLWLPAPLHSQAEGVVWLPDDAFIRAGADGFVSTVLARPGSLVRAAEVVIVSNDPELTEHLTYLRARDRELTAKLDAVRFTDRVEAVLAETELDMVRIERAREEHRAAGLQARARSQGVFVMPSADDAPGRFFKRGDILGFTLPPGGARIIRAAISQDDIDLVRHHLLRARVKLLDRLDQAIEIQAIREIPRAKDQLPSAALGTTGGGTTPVDPRDEHGLTALTRVFQVDLELAAPVPDAGFGGRALVRFEHDAEPLGWQLWRRLRQLLLSRVEI